MGVGIKAMLNSWSVRLAWVYTLLTITAVSIHQPPRWWVLIVIVVPNALIMAGIFAELAIDGPSFRGWLDGLAASASILFAALLTGYYLILAQLGIVMLTPSPYGPYLALAGPLGVLAFFTPPTAVDLIAMAISSLALIIGRWAARGLVATTVAALRYFAGVEDKLSKLIGALRAKLAKSEIMVLLIFTAVDLYFAAAALSGWPISL